MFGNKLLSVEKMIELENWLDVLPHDIQDGLNDEDLSEKLGLKIEYVDKTELGKDVEAELCRVNEGNYNGLIRLNKDLKNKKFSYMHEVMHYLRDVGVGNRVERTFSRKVKGKTSTIEEQEINYLTAAAIIPKKEMHARIQGYDSSSPKMDEVVFVNLLCEAFGQSQTTVLRRVREIRKMQKAKVI